MKSKAVTLLLLFVTTFLLNSCKENEFDPFCTITGKVIVTDEETGASLPVSDATVTLVAKETPVLTTKTVQTTADGVFTFENLDEGKYTVSVQKNGYTPDHKDIMAISGETINTILQIKKINIHQ